MTRIVSGVRIPYAADGLWETIYKLQQKKGFCWANDKKLAKEMSFSEGYIRKLIKKLDVIGWIARITVRDLETGAYIGRKIIALDKLSTPEEQVEALKKLETDNTSKGAHQRLMNNARKVQISPYRVFKAINVYGEEKVKEVIATIRVATTVNDHIAYFYGLLKNKDFKITDKARRVMDKMFVTTKHYVKAHHVKVVPALDDNGNQKVTKKGKPIFNVRDDHAKDIAEAAKASKETPTVGIITLMDYKKHPERYSAERIKKLGLDKIDVDKALAETRK